MEQSTCVTSTLNTELYYEFFWVSTLAASAQSLSPTCCPLLPHTSQPSANFQISLNSLNFHAFSLPSKLE